MDFHRSTLPEGYYLFEFDNKVMESKIGVMSVTRVKVLFSGMSKEHPSWDNGEKNAFDKPGEIKFIADSRCEDYDWLVVYDDIPRHDTGTVYKEMEPLACPPDQTVLITAEPPTIKIYPECYTRQFGYVLTTHDSHYLPHRHYKPTHSIPLPTPAGDGVVWSRSTPPVLQS